MPLRSFHLLTALLAAVLVPGLALAGGAADATVQVVDGYTISLGLPPERIQTGPNDVTVTIRTVDGSAVPGASVSVAVLAYGAEGGHGDSHGEAPASSAAHAPGDGHDDASSAPAADSHAAAPANDHADDQSSAAGSHEAAPADSHGADHAADGQGLKAIPTALEAGNKPGAYHGVLHFDQPGTATVSVAFTAAGHERAALFVIPVVQARPRALVLGGFALVNGLAIVAAAVLKRRMPQKGRTTRPAAAKPSVIPLTAVPAGTDEERPA